MKKTIVFLTTVCILVFTACGGSEPQPQPTVEPTPIATPVSDAQVVGDIEISIEASLDYVNENEDIDGATQFRNALLRGTSFQVLFADESNCEIEFKYPDAEVYLNKAADMLEDDATAEEMDTALALVAKEMETETLCVVKTITAEVTKNGDGTYSLVWNEDLYNAVSGGLYYAEER